MKKYPPCDEWRPDTVTKILTVNDQHDFVRAMKIPFFNGGTKPENPEFLPIVVTRCAENAKYFVLTHRRTGIRLTSTRSTAAHMAAKAKYFWRKLTPENRRVWEESEIFSELKDAASIEARRELR